MLHAAAAAGAGGVMAARVLVVEDELRLRTAVVAYLESIGHEVEAAADPAEAIDAGSRFEPDVLICDWWLGERSDGVEVARTLARSRAAPAMIFITGYSTNELRSRVRDLPVHAVLAKPVGLGELADEVQRALAA